MCMGSSIWGLFVYITPTAAQERLDDGDPLFRVKVNLVVLNVAVTDRRGRYVNGLKPNDFRVYEDGILQPIATFGEGNRAPREVTYFQQPQKQYVDQKTQEQHITHYLYMVVLGLGKPI